MVDLAQTITEWKDVEGNKVKINAKSEIFLNLIFSVRMMINI